MPWSDDEAVGAHQDVDGRLPAESRRPHLGWWDPVDVHHHGGGAVDQVGRRDPAADAEGGVGIARGGVIQPREHVRREDAVVIDDHQLVVGPGALDRRAELGGGAVVVHAFDQHHALQLAQILRRAVGLLLALAERGQVETDLPGRAGLAQQALQGVVDHRQAAGQGGQADHRVATIRIFLALTVQRTDIGAGQPDFIDDIEEKVAPGEEVVGGEGDDSRQQNKADDNGKHGPLNAQRAKPDGVGSRKVALREDFGSASRVSPL